jgi:hypothetical protein
MAAEGGAGTETVAGSGCMGAGMGSAARKSEEKAPQRARRHHSRRGCNTMRGVSTQSESDDGGGRDEGEAA